MNSELDILVEPLYACQSVNIGEYDESPVEHVRQRAREKGREVHHIFCEMLELCKINGLDYTWYENARWIKYEETAEGAKQRWSKPHIPLLTLQSIFQLKNCFRRGLIMLDCDPTSFPLLVDTIVRCWEEGGFVDSEESIGLRAILLCNKEHVGKRRRIKHSKIPGMERRRQRSLSDSQHIDTGSASDLDNMTDDEPPEADATINMELSKKLPDDVEVATIHIGRLDSISKPVCAFIRLNESKMFLNLSEVPRPLRFMFILLVPEDHTEEELDMVGRALGALLTDEVFVNVAYAAMDAIDLACGIDEFLSSILIIPPGKWRKDVRLEPTDAVANIERETRRTAAIAHQKKTQQFFHFEGLQFSGRVFGGLIDDLRRRLPFFVSDFTDSFTSFNAFSQCMAAVLYLFFANLTNIITFGGVMGSMLHNEMGVMECILAGFMSGIVFGLFSGQPLNILSATGPVLIFESLFYKFCLSQGWEFLPARFWLGTWTSAMILIFVAVDASFLVAYITRFTEEAFATLISIIFIVESFMAMAKLRYPSTEVVVEPALTNLTGNGTTSGLIWDPAMLRQSCVCQIYDEGLNVPMFQNLSISACVESNGVPQCVTCPPPSSSSDGSFMFAILLFLATFLLSYGFKYFRFSPFFPSKVRNLVADFSVFLSIVIMTCLSIVVGVPVKTLEVPKSFEPTKVGRNDWFVDPLHGIDWWVALACGLPALLLTVLVIMDQQITAVIVNRKDNKLKKGFGYHLDLLVVSLLIFVCSMLGLPIFVAATILSIAHVQSLRMESETAAPGEKPMFLGVREQRVTAIIAHILIGLSIFLTPIQQKVPLAVLLGIFLYMGVSSLAGQQFVQRLLIFFMPVKYQPDYTFLRLIALKRVHLFTGIQLVAFIMLMAVKYTKPVSMLFPIMLIVLVGVRIYLDRIFTAKECSALDDPLPLWRHLKRGNEPVQFRRRSMKMSHSTSASLLKTLTPSSGAKKPKKNKVEQHKKQSDDDVFKA